MGVSSLYTTRANLQHKEAAQPWCGWLKGFMGVSVVALVSGFRRCWSPVAAAAALVLAEPYADSSTSVPMPPHNAHS